MSKPGAHKIRLSLEGYRDEEQDLELTSAETRAISLKLKPTPRSFEASHLTDFGSHPGKLSVSAGTVSWTQTGGKAVPDDNFEAQCSDILDFGPAKMHHGAHIRLMVGSKERNYNFMLFKFYNVKGKVKVSSVDADQLVAALTEACPQGVGPPKQYRLRFTFRCPKAAQPSKRMLRALTTGTLAVWAEVRGAAFVALALFAVGAAGAVLSARPQSSTALSKEKVVNLLNGDVSPKRVATLARQRGIDFQVTAQVVEEVRHAGGDDALLAVLRELAPKVTPGAVRQNPKDGLKYVWVPPGTFM